MAGHRIIYQDPTGREIVVEVPWDFHHAPQGLVPPPTIDFAEVDTTASTSTATRWPFAFFRIDRG